MANVYSLKNNTAKPLLVYSGSNTPVLHQSQELILYQAIKCNKSCQVVFLVKISLHFALQNLNLIKGECFLKRVVSN